MPQNAYLVLENGKVFQGKYFGAVRDVIGEIVFTTSVVGYLETLTDKSYYGQIVVQTFPLIGNYGVIPSDFESDKSEIKAYVIKQLCDYPSNFRSEGKLEDYFVKNNMTGMYGIDTRALTKVIRENGVMNGIITSNPGKVDFKKVKEYRVEHSVESVSSKSAYEIKSQESRYRLAVLDFGIKENIKRELLERNCALFVFPYDSDINKIKEVNPHGIILTNGPGDPADNINVIKNIKEMIKHKIPIFGICMGNQLLALANGFKTEKLKYGHRGSNQPVKNLNNGKTYISSQNHGYAVVKKSIDKKIAKEYFINVNDGTNEGIEYLNIPAFSVQFHPEACGGPHDTNVLFDKFLKMMEAYKNAVE